MLAGAGGLWQIEASKGGMEVVGIREPFHVT